MIFVTVGTTYFEELVQEIDRLAGCGAVTDRVFVQIGSGRYIPEHVEWVRYVDNMREVEEAADLVICAGGATVFKLLLLGKRFIATPNRQVKDDHQATLLRELEARGWCSCCWDISKLGELLAAPSPCQPYPGDAELVWRIWSDLFPDLVRRPDSMTSSPDKASTSGPPSVMAGRELDL